MVVDSSFSGLVRRPLPQGAWVDYAPQWVSGHERLFELLRDVTAWRQTSQQIYDRTVQTPRRIASLSHEEGTPAIVGIIADALSQRYGVQFDRISAALYRDGQDSVAWHRDREYRERGDAVVAVVSLGTPRRFLLRPYRRPSASRKTGSERSPLRSTVYTLGWGDLLVMGGTAQRTWEHAVPKVRHADPRISLMFRHDPDSLTGGISALKM